MECYYIHDAVGYSSIYWHSAIALPVDSLHPFHYFKPLLPSTAQFLRKELLNDGTLWVIGVQNLEWWGKGKALLVLCIHKSPTSQTHRLQSFSRFQGAALLSLT